MTTSEQGATVEPVETETSRHPAYHVAKREVNGGTMLLVVGPSGPIKSERLTGYAELDDTAERDARELADCLIAVRTEAFAEIDAAMADAQMALRPAEGCWAIGRGGHVVQEPRFTLALLGASRR